MGSVRSQSARLGPYVLGDRLGAGGMAEVYAATRLGPRGFTKRVAVKCMLPQLARDPVFIDMFCDEARIAAALSHPNLTQVLDFGEHDGRLFMALEYVEGVSLAKLLRTVHSQGRQFPLNVAAYIASSVLAGLAFAHSARDEHGCQLGIVHRDVSPGNILIGLGGQVKLTDFGILKGAFIERRTHPGELKGKLGYMSPEQVMGAELDARSDVFSLGIVLAEMLILRPLFPGPSEFDALTRISRADLAIFERHSRQLPDELRSVVRRALAREPADRFGSAREMAEALQLAVAVGKYEAVELQDWLAKVLPRARSGVRARVAVPMARRPAPAKQISSRPPSGRPTCPEPIQIKPRLADALSRAALGHQPAQPEASPDLSPEARRVLQRFGERPEFRPVPTSFDATWEREASRLEIFACVAGLWAAEGTGLLVVSASEGTRRVFFDRGVPVWLSAIEASELFGQLLIRRRLLSAANVQRVVESAAVAERPLGRQLVIEGLLKPAQVLRSLQMVVADRLLKVGRLRKCTLRFYAGVRCPSLSLPPTAGLELLRRLLVECYGDDELTSLLAPMVSTAILPRTARRTARHVEHLPESLALSLLEDTRHVDDALLGLVAQGVATGDAVRALVLAAGTGALTLQDWPWCHERLGWKPNAGSVVTGRTQRNSV